MLFFKFENLLGQFDISIIYSLIFDKFFFAFQKFFVILLNIYIFFFTKHKYIYIYNFIKILLKFLNF
jgi:hypothetical protein